VTGDQGRAGPRVAGADFAPRARGEAKGGDPRLRRENESTISKCAAQGVGRAAPGHGADSDQLGRGSLASHDSQPLQQGQLLSSVAYPDCVAGRAATQVGRPNLQPDLRVVGGKSFEGARARRATALSAQGADSTFRKDRWEHL